MINIVFSLFLTFGLFILYIFLLMGTSLGKFQYKKVTIMCINDFLKIWNIDIHYF